MLRQARPGHVPVFARRSAAAGRLFLCPRPLPLAPFVLSTPPRRCGPQAQAEGLALISPSDDPVGRAACTSGRPPPLLHGRRKELRRRVRTGGRAYAIPERSACGRRRVARPGPGRGQGRPGACRGGVVCKTVWGRHPPEEGGNCAEGRCRKAAQKEKDGTDKCGAGHGDDGGRTAGPDDGRDPAQP